ncbi:MAG TPA: thermonuclease family protein [Hyphomicrobium sp.]|nr:thermonuclease family protein [Hyphomicrobium sp.]
MKVCFSNWFYRRPVAFALVGVASLAVLSSIPPRATVARSVHNAGALVGAARIIDGDTLDVAGERVRLEGIDAPEMTQTCGRNSSGAWKCGVAAAGRLAELVRGHTVTCENRGHDKYGRMLGICFVKGRDINAEMVREGLAWAFVRYSQTYVHEEAQARAARAGIWQGEAAPAWEYREHRWAGAEQGAPNGCAIKGNITAHGHIYHMPWSAWYADVKIEPEKGERWFCSEAQAISAGWRPVTAE